MWKAIGKVRRFSLPAHQVVGIPALSPTMTHGNLASWKLKQGDSMSAGDVVCEIETDKAIVDFEAQDDLFLAKILIEEGAQDVPVGTPMMVTVEEEEDIAAFADFVPEKPESRELPKEAIPPAKDEVPVDNGEPVTPVDFLVQSQTVNEEKKGATVEKSAGRKTPATDGNKSSNIGNKLSNIGNTSSNAGESGEGKSKSSANLKSADDRTGFVKRNPLLFR